MFVLFVSTAAGITWYRFVFAQRDWSWVQENKFFPGELLEHSWNFVIISQ